MPVIRQRHPCTVKGAPNATSLMTHQCSFPGKSSASVPFNGHTVGMLPGTKPHSPSAPIISLRVERGEISGNI